MEKISEPRLFMPLYAKEDADLNPSELLEKSIVKLFMHAFDIDIKTCTSEEWAERITIEGGTLNQWQSFIK